jgi:hypothetical protein
MTAGIARRARIDTDQAEIMDLYAGFFPHLAATGGLCRLADLNEAARERMAPAKRIVPAANEQDPRRRIEDHAVGRERRRPWQSHRRLRKQLARSAARP